MSKYNNFKKLFRESEEHKPCHILWEDFHSENPKLGNKLIFYISLQEAYGNPVTSIRGKWVEGGYYLQVIPKSEREIE